MIYDLDKPGEVDYKMVDGQNVAIGEVDEAMKLKILGGLEVLGSGKMLRKQSIDLVKSVLDTRNDALDYDSFTDK